MINDITIPIGQFSVNPSLVGNVRWIDSTIHQDQRGYFFEAYREDIHRILTGDYSVQTNVSISAPMVLRGFHWHKHQFDFWTIASGMAQVVVATDDELQENRVLSTGMGVIIPPYVAHGFLALSPLVLIYNVSELHDQEQPDEQGFSARAFDGWLTPIDQTIRSQRDIEYDTYAPGNNIER